MKLEYQINVNGFVERISVDKKDIDQVFLTIIKQLIELSMKKEGRFYCFFAASAGGGKTTLSLLMKLLAKQYFNYDLQVLGIDGFHYYNDYLNSHYDSNGTLLKDIKGNQITFDVEKMYRTLNDSLTKDVYWPLYDRVIHDPIETAIKVDSRLIILEGNYLLLNDENWQKLHKFCDYSIMLDVDENVLKERLIRRKQKGGLTLQESKKWYQQVDKVNVETIKNNSIESDCLIRYDGNHYHLLKI